VSPEKGLHLFLHALPVLRRTYPDLRLTVVGDHGPDWYRREIDHLLDSLKLRDVVVTLPGVPRREVPAYYAEHDVLLFYSPNAEPVALVAKEAFAAGIPVVCSRPISDSPLIQDGVTCLTYDSTRMDSVVSAISRMLRDEELRKMLARNARDVVVSTFSNEAMGHQFDDLLRGLLLR
jgi:glycosyltransferase involved in cell wall biosynthesis